MQTYFLSKVSDLVQLQYVVVAKGLAANVTGVGLFPGVRPRMDFQLLGASEALVADAAHVRFFTCVRPCVDHQLP